MSLKADTLSTRGFLARLVSPLTPTGASPAQSGKVRSGWALAGIATGSPRIPGFTLIELMVTMAMAAILLTVGVPSFQSMIRNNRAATHMNEMISALNLARSEAAKRGGRVSLCPSTDQATCTGGTNWNNGWIVFVDISTDESAVTVGTVLGVGEALSGSPTLTGPASVRYRFTGGTLPDGTSVQFDYALDTVTQMVCVSPVGRPRVEKVATSCP